MVVSYVFFALIAIIVIGTALGMLFSRNAVYAALYLALNFAAVALLYLILGAPFIALVQITVYAGSIMVLFLFVIMLLGAERLKERRQSGPRWGIAWLLGLVFLAELGLFTVLQSGLVAPTRPPGAEAGSPETVGLALFTQYALPFEMTAFILLAATVGAILLTRGEGQKPYQHRPVLPGDVEKES